MFKYYKHTMMFALKAEQFGECQPGSSATIETLDKTKVTDDDCDGTAIDELIKYYRTNKSELPEDQSLVMIDNEEEDHIREEIKSVNNETKAELLSFLEESIIESDVMVIWYKNALVTRLVDNIKWEWELYMFDTWEIYLVPDYIPHILPDRMIKWHSERVVWPKQLALAENRRVGRDSLFENLKKAYEKK